MIVAEIEVYDDEEDHLLREDGRNGLFLLKNGVLVIKAYNGDLYGLMQGIPTGSLDAEDSESLGRKARVNYKNARKRH